MSNNKDSIFWWVILIIILSPFVMLAPSGEAKVMDKKQARRRASNIIGLIVLGLIVVGVTFHYLFLKREEDATSVIMNDVARQFAEHDSEAMMTWAKGNITDTWGNTIILSSNNKEDGVCFISKGRDGELGTNDDINSNCVSLSDKPIPKLDIVLEPSPKKSVTSRIKEKIGEFFKGED